MALFEHLGSFYPSWSWPKPWPSLFDHRRHGYGWPPVLDILAMAICLAMFYRAWP